MAAVLRSESQVTDFVERFTRDPYGVALDLLNTKPTDAIVTGIAHALRRTPRAASREQRSQLFSSAVRLIIRRADGEVVGPNYKSLAQIALLGVAEEHETLLEEGISTLLDVNQLEWADTVAAQFAPAGGLDARLSKRLATELVLRGLPNRCFSLERLNLAQPDWRELVETALVKGAYDWAIKLSGWVDHYRHPVMSLRPLAIHLLHTSTGTETCRVLQAIGGQDAAARLLRSMLYDLDIPPAEVGRVTSWLGDAEPLQSRMSEYVSLALRQSQKLRCYANIVHWARERDLAANLGRRLLDILVRAEEYETALLVLHAAGLRRQYGGLIAEAEKALDPGTTAGHSSRWVDVVFDKCWLDWSPQFRSKLIDYAETNASGMSSDTWSPKAVEKLAVKLRDELNRMDGVVRKAACELAGNRGGGCWRCCKSYCRSRSQGNLELALDLAAEWAIKVRDLDLDSQSEAIMCQAAELGSPFS